MTRTDSEAFTVRNRSVLRLSFPAEDEALIIALTWTYTMAQGDDVDAV